MRQFRLFLIFLLLSTAGKGIAQIPNFVLHEAPVSEGARILHQDHRGFIWAGTEEGLFRFDGQEWKAFPHADSVGSKVVSALGEGENSVLWIGYQDGRIYFLENGQQLPFLPEEGLPKVPISGIGEDSLGILWIATYGEGIYYYRDGRMYNINQDDGLADNDVYDICLDPQGHIWAGTDGGLSICWLEAGEKKIRNLDVNDGLPDYIVRSVTCDPEGHLWVGLYDGGFCHYDPVADTFWVPELARNWTLGPVNTLASVGGEVWLGTGGHGLWVWNQEGLQQASPQSRAKIHDLLTDQQGNLWVADNSEDIRSGQLRFGFLAEPNETIHALHAGQSGTLWFSTDAGLFSRRPGEERPQKHALPLSMNIISLYEDVQGYLWVGGFGAGIYRFDTQTGAGRQYTESEGLLNGNVLSITGNEHEVWLATLGGASRVELGEKVRFQNFDRKDDPAISYLYHILLDSQGRTWFASDGNGLSYRKGETFIHLPELDGLTVYTLVEDLQGRIWFSTADEGLFSYDGARFVHFGLEEGLSDLLITGLSCDLSGRLILSHPNGIDILDPETGQFTHYGEEVGIGSIEPDLNAITRDKEGNVWIGTRKGILRCRHSSRAYVSQPQIRILEAKASLKPLKGDEPHLPYDQNYLTFEYTGLWYQAPEAVSYQHRLEGFAPEWITTRDQQVAYPQLPPGNYTFSVRAAAGPSFEQAELADIRFVILPPVWQRWWFVLLCLIAGAGIAYGLIKLREQRLRKTERLEREKVEFQFETLKSQINPHFLFNSFNTLITLIEEDDKGAVEYVEKLSDFFRNMLEFRSHTLISLEEELALLQSYYFLQQKRYGKNLVLDIQLSPDERSGQIAPLSLQMLIENAVKHNVVSRNKPLVVEIRRKGNYLIVKNTLQPKRRAAPSTHIGLQNITNRYLLIGGHEVRIEKTDTDFIVGIPVRE